MSLGISWVNLSDTHAAIFIPVAIMLQIVLSSTGTEMCIWSNSQKTSHSLRLHGPYCSFTGSIIFLVRGHTYFSFAFLRLLPTTKNCRSSMISIFYCTYEPPCTNRYWEKGSWMWRAYKGGVVFDRQAKQLIRIKSFSTKLRILNFIEIRWIFRRWIWTGGYHL
jgi:hypothetical protein